MQCDRVTRYYQHTNTHDRNPAVDTRKSVDNHSRDLLQLMTNERFKPNEFAFHTIVQAQFAESRHSLVPMQNLSVKGVHSNNCHPREGLVHPENFPRSYL